MVITSRLFNAGLRGGDGTSRAFLGDTGADGDSPRFAAALLLFCRFFLEFRLIWVPAHTRNAHASQAPESEVYVNRRRANHAGFLNFHNQTAVPAATNATASRLSG